jgi:hypothetical protein
MRDTDEWLLEGHRRTIVGGALKRGFCRHTEGRLMKWHREGSSSRGTEDGIVAGALRRGSWRGSWRGAEEG